MSTEILGLEFDAVKVLVVLGVLIAILLRSIVNTIERSTSSIGETLTEIRSSLELMRQHTTELDSIRVDVQRLRRHVAGSIDGEIAEALADWDARSGHE